MKWETNFRSERYRFYIEKEECINMRDGSNFYVYTFYVDDSQGKDHRDYEQDDLDMAKRSANSDFNIPLDSWTQVG